MLLPLPSFGKGSAIKDGIHDKGFRNRPLTQVQIARNKSISKRRSIVEGVFGSWKQLYGWVKTKYYGLEKNYLAATLTALSWNMKKWAFSSA
ncbi:transposase [Candidatus Saganbacteria bacterium]|nr:transposase [Candidatus Saganbacteria bacterium]